MKQILFEVLCLGFLTDLLLACDVYDCKPVKCPSSCNGDPYAHPGCGINCGKTCKTYQNAGNISCIQICYENGCDCNTGYVLNEETKLCVHPKDCPKCANGDPNGSPGCGVNCGNTCKTYNSTEPVACPLKCEVNGCDCNVGFVLEEKTRRCIRPEECPNTSCKGDPNAVPGCGVNCGRTCKTYQSADRISCILECKDDSCDCKEGFVLDESTNHCIESKDCPKCANGDPNGSPGCGVNCGNTCKTYNSTEPVACPLICEVNGCDCNVGFVLEEKTRRCIRPEECPPTCPEGEVYNTCPSSDYCLLKDPNRYPMFSPTVCDDPRCVCGFNQKRSRDTNKCIAASSCPPFPCAENEEYDSCPPTCPGETCEDYLQNSTCPKFGRIGIVVACKPQCRCATGYYRDGDKNCVAAAQCKAIQPTCPPGEVWERCPAPCPEQICSSIWSRIDCTEANSNYICKGECRCKDGYRNDIGQCISTENCIKCNGPNEYFACGSACDNVCFDLEVRNQTSCDVINVVCNEMCYCKDGYARTQEGICVKYEDCPPKCTGKNEVFSTCANSCPPTCDSINSPEGDTCVGPAVCLTACVCLDGYYRNYKGECVPKSECFKCKGPNEYFACGSACDNVCFDLEVRNQTSCDVINVVCNEMCYCKDGYARTQEGICVKYEDCPPKCTGKNEVFSTCANSCPPTCDSINSPEGDTCVGPAVCLTACVCLDGYYRNYKGECVPKSECFKCNGPNEYFSCGSACDNVCFDLEVRNQTSCDVINVVCNEMCYCKDGYARTQEGICVKYEDCPPKCTGKNEVFSTCASSCPPTCDSIGAPEGDICVGAAVCKTACVCLDGYYRNNKGECVAKSECTSCGGDHNAVPGCGVNCNQKCSDVLGTKSSPCPKICKVNACDCKPGFYLDENTNNCVTACDCTY